MHRCLVVTIVLIALLSFSCKPNKGDYKQIAMNTQESCLNCHADMTGFSPYHNPQNIGCASCHLGQVQEADKDKAHKGMVLIPGNLSTINQTCATANCHPSEADRISKSLMTTNSGIVTVNKLLFEELHHTDTLIRIADIGHSAAETHLRNLCFTCHLDKEKEHYAVSNELSRGGGCVACHLNYTHQTTAEIDITDNIHPALNLQIDNGKCFGCHSRSGRITTNYEGWYEIDEFADSLAMAYHDRWINDEMPRGTHQTSLYDSLVDSDGKVRYLRLLRDGRVFGKAPEDVHHSYGLACIDCHSSQEVMGDGHAYKHQADALKVQCSDCHTDSKHQTIKFNELDAIAVKDYALRGYTHYKNGFISTAIDSIGLVNTYFNDEGTAFLKSKLSGEDYQLSPMCERDAVHANLTCSMCHSSWAPTCIGCHSEYNPDFKNRDGSVGRWQEHVAAFSADLPVMGVSDKDGKTQVIPTIPGMIMTLDKSKFAGEKLGADHRFVRWFAPSAPHTTTKTVRDCKSCHLDPYAMGYGQGELDLVTQGNVAHWQLTSYYASSEQDGLPQDSWIGFLKDTKPNKDYSSHEYLKPMNLAMQKRVLKVGACITCHGNDPGFVDKMLAPKGYDNLLRRMSKSCLVPR